MSDLKTALVTALNSTPLQPKPLKERVWLWIKDHPGIHKHRLLSDLKLTENERDKALHELACKSLIRGQPAPKQPGRRNGGKALFAWYVTTSVWEDAPWPKKKPKERATVAQPASPAPTPAPHVEKPVAAVPQAPEPALPDDLSKSVEQLTIAQGRKLYNLLHKLYGDKT